MFSRCYHFRQLRFFIASSHTLQISGTLVVYPLLCEWSFQCVSSKYISIIQNHDNYKQPKQTKKKCNICIYRLVSKALITPDYKISLHKHWAKFQYFYPFLGSVLIEWNVFSLKKPLWLIESVLSSKWSRADKLLLKKLMA